MAVDERTRKQIYDWFDEHMGAERADAMMELLPPVGWADVATKHDLAQLEEKLKLHLQAELHRQMRNQFIAILGAMAVMNTAVAALA